MAGGFWARVDPVPPGRYHAPMFHPSAYIERRKALALGLAQLGEAEGTVLFLGSRESPMNYPENAYEFRQDSSFLYFVGTALPGLAATMRLPGGETTFYADGATLDDIVWTGPQRGPAELAADSGIASVRPRSALAGDLSGARALGRAARILYFPPYRADARAELAEIAGAPYAGVNAGASEALIKAAIALREIKSEAEVAELEKAVSVTVDMHKAALSTARAGMLESDVYGRVAQVALASGGGLSFPVIATTRGEILHTHHRDSRLEAGSLFLLDAGAEAPSGYAGDLSTTFPVSPRFDSRQRAVYELTLRMHAAAVAALAPGASFRDVHLAAAREGAAGLKELGLMRGDSAEAAVSGAYALFFPCGVGHMIGLDVHDMEDYGELLVGYGGAPRSELFGLKSLRLAKALKPGMTFTVEPGIYFIPELFARWKAEGRFSQFIDYAAAEPWLGLGGIRNEEDWIVTAAGARRLGPEFDKSAAAIERMRE
jgi:Xaa-Pro aminopeptidase